MTKSSRSRAKAKTAGADLAADGEGTVLNAGVDPRVVVPTISPKRFYGLGIPKVKLEGLTGKLVVIEGADGSGRSTQIALLEDWLQSAGHATVQVGLKHSSLVSEELVLAQQGNTLSPRTFSLFYATDFADQLENVIMPALKAGMVVLADRYIYTLMARDLVRGHDESWVKNLYGIALVPDAVFYLRVSPERLVQRNFAKDYALDYWESGMDLGLSRDMFKSFLAYQSMVEQQFEHLQAAFHFTILDGHRPIQEIHEELKDRIQGVLSSSSNET